MHWLPPNEQSPGAEKHLSLQRGQAPQGFMNLTAPYFLYLIHFTHFAFTVAYFSIWGDRHPCSMTAQFHKSYMVISPLLITKDICIFPSKHIFCTYYILDSISVYNSLFNAHSYLRTRNLHYLYKSDEENEHGELK